MLGGHEQTANAVAFSPDGLIATGGNDQLIVLHDARTGRIVGTPLRLFETVYTLDFSPDGELLVAGAFGASPAGQVAAVVDVDSGEFVAELSGAEGLTDARFSSDGTRVLVGSGTTQEWRVGSWNPVSPPIETQHGPAHAVSGAEHDLLGDGG